MPFLGGFFGEIRGEGCILLQNAESVKKSLRNLSVRRRLVSIRQVGEGELGVRSAASVQAASTVCHERTVVLPDQHFTLLWFFLALHKRKPISFRAQGEMRTMSAQPISPIMPRKCARCIRPIQAAMFLPPLQLRKYEERVIQHNCGALMHEVCWDDQCRDFDPCPACHRSLDLTVGPFKNVQYVD